MSQQLISHNKDLKRLRDEGYNIEVFGGHLFVHQIPYVNALKEIKYGILITPLNMSGDKTIKPHNHVMIFSGEYPCNKEGKHIEQIKHTTNNTLHDNGIKANYSFSNKPVNGYPDFYEKVKRYSEIISAHAISIDESITDKPFTPIVEDKDDSVFKYLDTNSSRSNIDSINRKLEAQNVGIIGVGGTGAYILDMISKTNVKEIHIYDNDIFLNHNAFRSPGAASIDDLNKKVSKVDYYKAIYSKIRNGIFGHNYYVNSTNLTDLSGLDYVFICIDNNVVRKQIINYLLEINIPFIDVGLGVNIVNNSLIGQFRVTSANQNKFDHIDKLIPKEDNTDNDYITNIQIVELNLLNAGFAVLKWKKMSGFYQDLENEFHSTYSINNSFLNNEEIYEI